MPIHWLGSNLVVWRLIEIATKYDLKCAREISLNPIMISFSLHGIQRGINKMRALGTIWSALLILQVIERVSMRRNISWTNPPWKVIKNIISWRIVRVCLQQLNNRWIKSRNLHQNGKSWWANNHPDLDKISTPLPTVTQETSRTASSTISKTQLRFWARILNREELAQRCRRSANSSSLSARTPNFDFLFLFE